MTRFTPLSGVDDVTVMEKPNNGGSRLLHGTTCHIYHRPAVPRAEPARELDFIGDLRTIDIVGKVAVADKVHAVAPNFGDALGGGDKPDNECGMWLGKTSG
jgi:hypothetical protein